jgi:uncharacterized protein
MPRRIVGPLVVAVAVIAMARTTVAGPLDDGVTAARQGDFGTAMRLWRPLAEQGDATAQFDVGYLFDNGSGVRQDYTEAMKWYRLAADQDLAAAQYSLGVMYDDGDGGPQD